MLAVQVLHAVSVGDLHDLTCAGVILTGSVDLQFHAKIARTIAAKQRLRLVIIVFDHFIPTRMGMAVIAERAIFIVIFIVGIIYMNDTPAAFTAGIVPVIAGLAEGRIFIPGIVISADTPTAVGADYSFLIGTAFAEFVLIHQNVFVQQMGLPASAAGKSLSAHIISSICKNRPRGITPRPSLL